MIKRKRDPLIEREKMRVNLAYLEKRINPKLFNKNSTSNIVQINREMVNKSMTLAPIPEKTERKNNIDEPTSSRKRSVASNSSPKETYNQSSLIGSRTSGKLISQPVLLNKKQITASTIHKPKVKANLTETSG